MVDQRNFAGNIAYDDLREWLAHRRAAGRGPHRQGRQLARRTSGSPPRRCCAPRTAPAWCSTTFRAARRASALLLNMFAGTRRNMTLGFPDHLTKWELSDAYREAYLQEQQHRSRTRSSTTARCFENIMMGDDIDVTKFPSPIWHEKDGGRYIGTGTYSITRDPEENWLNAGAYRAQVHDKKTVGMVMAAGHHGRIHRDKYVQARRADAGRHGAGRRSDRVLLRRAGGALRRVRARPRRRHARPADEDGARQGHRPAVPGQCRDRARRLRHARQAPMPKARSANGPDTTPAACEPCPVLDIKAIYHRNDPILLGVPPMGGGPGRDGALSRGDALGHDQAEHRPMPACPACSRCGATRSAARACCTRVSITQRYPGHAVQAGACRRAVRRLGLCVEIHRGGRRRCRRHQSRPPAVGDADAHRSRRSRSSSSPARGIRAPTRRCRRSAAPPAT